MKDIPALFGSLVFNDKVMREKLPGDTYKAVKKSIETGNPLELDVANVVANAMKEWAIDKGVTHFTHWFQPMTGVTAEKHDSFIKPAKDGGIIMDFSGKALVQGESDASSFPSGGLRATFEARGYTAWDPTSFAFIKNGTLCIPTAYCGYNGEALDKKTPLLRSMQAINKQALRILKLFGHNTDIKKIITTVGPEQEYFLIDKDAYEQRLDLICCGRTLFGKKPPKGQELDDHYFGAIKPRVSAFMKELDEELWKLGVLSKTEHNEAAPSQHELAPIYTTTNIATDHNQITMELMKSIAPKYNMTCLLHEKPFAGVNGSGKHNNWSLATDNGINLLEPGDTPYANAQFLLFFTAVIKAVDEYQDMLRVSVASAGNDHRLGANEAPPAIVSMFVGAELAEVLDALENGNGYNRRKKTQMEIGVDFLPRFSKDTTDRNRTSPFAFTGNKFEFRMPGSAFSVSGPNIVLNTIVAESLSQFADELENGADFTEDLNLLIKRNIKKHKRIIFNGNNYSEDWVKEAQERGLLNLRHTVDALPRFIEPKNIEVFTKHCVFTASEMHSRYEILLENYSKTIRIEALTMLEMIRKQIIPSVVLYEKDLAETVVAMASAGITPAYEKELLKDISSLLASLNNEATALETKLNKIDSSEKLEVAKYYHDEVFAAMSAIRTIADELETKVAKKYWAFPTYTDLLFSIK